MPTVARTLEITPAAGYLAANEVVKCSLFKGGIIDPKRPITIYMVYKILKTVYDEDANYENLQVVANYLYELIQKWAFKAAAIVDGNTGGEVAPVTPTDSTGVFPIYITQSNFINATQYEDDRLDGQNILVFLNEINRYLVSGEYSLSGSTLTILLGGFDATQFDYNIVIEKYTAGV